MKHCKDVLPETGEGLHGEKLGVHVDLVPTGNMPGPSTPVTVSNVQCNLPESISQSEVLEHWRKHGGKQWPNP